MDSKIIIAGVAVVLLSMAVVGAYALWPEPEPEDDGVVLWHLDPDTDPRVSNGHIQVRFLFDEDPREYSVVYHGQVLKGGYGGQATLFKVDPKSLGSMPFPELPRGASVEDFLRDVELRSIYCDLARAP